jgi:hypothetical protein
MGAALCRSRFGASNRGKVGRFDELRAGAGCVAPPLVAAAAGSLTGLGFGELGGGGGCVALESPKRSDARVVFPHLSE